MPARRGGLLRGAACIILSHLGELLDFLDETPHLDTGLIDRLSHCLAPGQSIGQAIKALDVALQSGVHIVVVILQLSSLHFAGYLGQKITNLC